MNTPEEDNEPTIKGIHAADLLARGLESAKAATGNPQAWQPPTPEELATLLPQYEIESLLGRGGMGAVYRGKQAALDRAVAIKLLPAELAADAEFMSRFQREARTLARLQHPGIVAVHDFGQTSQGHLYFVMEFVNGTDLSRLIHGPGINPVQALEVITQICDALQYAHSQGVIHRDIKPANVLINTEGRAKLADFGLARPTSEETASLTRSNVVMGTPDYMAPEQMAGHADHRADLYALGVMLYEMLTGQTPRGAWAPPSQRVQVDVRLDQVVVRALQQDPAMRYQQASEIKTDVDVIRTTPLPKVGKAKAKSAPAAPGQRTTPLPKAKKPVNRMAWAAAVVVLLALGAAIWFFQQHQTKDSIASATKEAPFVNSLGMKFVPVPGTDILMCVHETRRQDYSTYADEVPGVDATWKNPSDDGKPLVQGDNHPVVEVSWDDAAAFCAWLSKKEGRTYRLPTEREWNLAAAFDVSDPRSISDTDLKAMMAFPKLQYPWGTTEEKDWPKYGNYKGKEDGYEGMAPVMSFLPNRLGIFDLGGNAWEWCEGWNDTQKTKRILRGCGYMNYGGYRNSLTRLGRDPDFRFPVPPLDDYSRNVIPGFRMVVERSPSKRVEQAPTGAVPDHSALGSPSWHKLGFFGGHQDPELIRPDADGWIRTGKARLHVTAAEQPGKRFIAGDTALRFRLLWTEENIGNQASLWFRSETKPTQPDGLVNLHFSKDSLVFSERDRELPLGTPGPTLREMTFSQPFKAGDEALLEIIGIGNTVYARVNGQQAQVTTSNLRPKGWITLGGGGTCFKDAEYLHLDSLPDPLKALGWEVATMKQGDEVPWRDFLAELADGPHKNAQLGRVWTREEGGWRVKNYHAFMLPDEAGRSLAIRMTARIPPGENRGGAHNIAIRVRELDNGNCYSGFLFNTGSAKITGKTPLATYKLGPNFDSAASHTLEFRAEGGRFTLLIDGIEQGSVNDSTLTDGGLFGVHASAGCLVEKVEYRFLDVAPKKPTPATPSDAVLKARNDGGRLKVWGKTRRGPAYLGGAAEFDDFVQAVAEGDGWAAKRTSAPEIWFAASIRNTAKTDVPFRKLGRGLSRAARVTALDHQGAYLDPVYYNGEVKQPNAIALLRTEGTALWLGADGAILTAKAIGKLGIPPQDDFFVGAHAFTASTQNFISARPGGSVESWNSATGQNFPFPLRSDEVLEMDAAADFVVILTKDGQVRLFMDDGRPLRSSDSRITKAPSSSGPFVAVRAGRGMVAAQKPDGSWIAWGESDALAERVSSLGHVIDLDLDYDSKESELLMWIEPVENPPKPPVSTPVTPSDAVLKARERGGRLRVFGNSHRGPVELGKAAEFDDFRTVVASPFGWAARREGGDTYCMAGLESSHVGQAVELGPFLTSFLQRGRVPVMQMRTDGSYRNLFSRGGSQHRKEWADHRAVAFLNPGNYILSLDAGGKILRGEHWYGATVTDRISPPADFFLGATAYTTVRDHYITARPGLPVRSFNVKTGQVTDFPSSIREIVEMDAAADEQVIMRDGAGQVFVVTPDGKSHGSVPPDIGPAVAVRAGAHMFAAQRTDGTWCAWGEADGLVAQTARVGHAVDIGFHSQDRGKISYMIWIEPVDGSTAATPVSTSGSGNPIVDEVVEWVLKNQGDVVISQRDKRVSARSLDQIQPGRFDLTEVHLPGDHVTDAEFARLGSLRGLRKIELNGVSHITSLKPIAGLTELQALWLPGNQGLAEEELAHLTGMTHLGSLRLRLPGATGEGFRQLQRLPKLQLLSLHDAEFTEEGAKAIAGIAELDWLLLNGCVREENQKSLTAIARMTKLTSLDIDGTLTAEGFAALAPLKLTKLNLSSCKLDNAGFPLLTGSRGTLTELLMAWGATVSDEGIRHIVANFPYIEKIQASTGSTCTGASLRELARLPNLKSISWWVRGMKTADYVLLAELPVIEKIGVGFGTAITDEALPAFAKCQHLKEIHLTETAITDAGLKALQNIRPLKTVNLEKTKITPAGLAEFQKARPDVEVSHDLSTAP